MTRLTIVPMTIAALSASLSQAFVPSTLPRMPMNLQSSYTADQQRTTSPVVPQSDFYDRSSTKTVSSPPASESQQETSTAVQTLEATGAKSTTTSEPPAAVKAPVKKPAKAPIAKKNVHKEGVFSPVVYVAKDILGEERLNKLRGEVIALHSDAIKGFVATAESKVGQTVLRSLFEMSDKNKDGKIDKEELRAALSVLGFEWLNEKQINGIFDRADLDKNGDIDMEEWMKEAPKTLKTNLVKLAKNNGGKMGLLV